MTDKQIIKLNEITEMSQELGLYEDRPDWRITLQADHIKRLEEELKAKEQECERLKVNSEEQSYRYAELDADYICLQDKVGKLERAILRRNAQLDQLKAENEVLQKDLATIDAVKDTVIAQYKQLKQTLTEIKEMCKEEKGWVNCSDMKLTETAQFAQQIFDKISEVEE